MLVIPIYFGLFSIYPCLIFSKLVIYACYFYSIWLIFHLSCLIFSKLVIYAYYFYPIWLIFHLSLPYFQLVSYLCLLLLFNLAYIAFVLALFLGSKSSILVISIQFGLFCIYSWLIFRESVIYACYFYPIQLILHLTLSYFQQVSYLCLLLLFNLAYFAFILASFLASKLSMLVISIQIGLFCIYSCLIFSELVIHICYFYPIQLILHLFLPHFQLVSYLHLLFLSSLAYSPFILASFLASQLFMLVTFI